MLVLYDSTDDKIFCRALVWKARLYADSINVDSEITVMDRIYCINECDYEVMKKFAADNGWWFKAEQNYHNKMGWIMPKKFFDKHKSDLLY